MSYTNERIHEFISIALADVGIQSRHVPVNCRKILKNMKELFNLNQK